MMTLNIGVISDARAKVIIFLFKTKMQSLAIYKYLSIIRFINIGKNYFFTYGYTASSS